jgi:hypothetical protein
MTRRQWLLAWCVAVALLLAGTTMPGSLKSEIEGQLWHAWPWSASAHFTLFAVIAAIPVYGQVRTWPLRALAVALGLAVLTEWLQGFVPGRHPLLRDVVIDLGGAMAGVVASLVWPRPKNPRKAGFRSQA